MKVYQVDPIEAAAERIDNTMAAWQRKQGEDFEAELRRRLGGAPVGTAAEDPPVLSESPQATEVVETLVWTPPSIAVESMAAAIDELPTLDKPPVEVADLPSGRAPAPAASFEPPPLPVEDLPSEVKAAPAAPAAPAAHSAPKPRPKPAPHRAPKSKKPTAQIQATRRAKRRKAKHRRR